MFLNSTTTLLLSVFSVLFLINIYSTQSKGVNCEESYTCSNTSVSQKRVKCFGYESCKDSNIECNRNCAMNGYYSGQYSSIMSHNKLRCDGYYSCNYVPQLYVNGNFYCDGSNAVQHSNVDITGDAYLRTYLCMYYSNITGNGNGKLDVNGVYGAHLSTISGFSQIDVTGYYGIGAAQIYSNGNDITINLDAYYASNGAEIYCESGDTCIVNCNGITSCHGLTVYYHTNSNFQGNCDNNCSNCDTFYQNPYSFDTVEELKQSAMYLQHKMEIEEGLESNELQIPNNNNNDDVVNHKDNKINDIKGSRFGKIGNKLLSGHDKINLISKINNNNEDESQKKLIEFSEMSKSVFKIKLDNNGILGFNDNQIISITIGASLTIILSVVGYVLSKKNIN